MNSEEMRAPFEFYRFGRAESWVRGETAGVLAFGNSIIRSPAIIGQALVKRLAVFMNTLAEIITSF